MNKNNKSNNFLQLTLDLLGFNTPSGQEQVMQEYVVTELNKTGFKISIDDIGNIYAVRGKAKEYPLLNAHMDIVEPYFTSYYTTYTDIKSCSRCYCFEYCVKDKMKDFDFTRTEAITALFQFNKKHDCPDYFPSDEAELKEKKNKPAKEMKISVDKNNKITGNRARILGGDDKCGIAIALQVAKETKIPMKILFTVEEETGCYGIKHFITNHKEWFDDVKYGITIDRRESDHLLLNSSGEANCTLAFGAEIAKQGILAGIPVRVEYGTLADVIYIRQFCEAVNISAGYYNPHTLDEYVQFNDMIAIKNWVYNIVNNI